MLCDDCHKNEATIHIKEIADGKAKSVNLCGECAAKAENSAQLNLSDLGLGEILKNLHKTISGMDKETGKPVPQLVCPSCGWDTEKISSTGRLGCAECYTVFRSIVENSLKDFQRGTLHLGKIPAAGQDAFDTRSLKFYQDELARAVEDENYEKAAELRDAIVRMTGRTGRKNGKSGGKE